MQQPTAQTEMQTAEVVIRFSAEDMDPQTMSMRVRPGAAHSLELGPDSPFTIQVVPRAQHGSPCLLNLSCQDQDYDEIQYAACVSLPAVKLLLERY